MIGAPITRGVGERGEMTDTALDVTVVIPHYAGAQVVECLEALFACPDRPAAVVLVDDGSTDGTAERAAQRFPSIRLVRNPVNLGFVGACNRGLAEVASAWAVLLNDDALADPGWLAALVRALAADRSVAAVQPKIVTVADPARFDYAGAAGGLIDRYGYPFALGRWFDRTEIDRGQYDAPREIFWASGTAMGLSMEAYRRVGPLETAFRMHMEEIDWCWRCILAGYRIMSVPSARVRHHGAMTLRAASPRKMYLNHRNSFLMLLKNYSAATLVRVLPARLGLEALTVVAALATGQFWRALGAFAGPFGAMALLPRIWPARRRVQAMRVRPDAEVARFMYGGSIALRHLRRLPAPAPSPSGGA